jgi:moderate conductance mechanosensitive channel
MPDLTVSPWSDLLAFLGTRVLPILVIVVVTIILVRLSRIFVHGIVKTLLDREATEGTAQELSAVEIQKRMTTLDVLGSNVIRLFLVIIAGLMVLERLGVNIGPAIAGLGVVGIAVGFGAQHLVRDYLSGALILIENQFSKGDVVQIAGVSGAVEDFSLRRTTLRDLDGVVHTVPNGEIKVASNMTRVWARVNEHVTVAYGTDLEHAVTIIDEVGREMAADRDWRRRILEPPRVERVQELTDSGITLKILGTVGSADRWAVAGELRRRLLLAFAEHGIEIPFPHRVIISRPSVSTGAAQEPATQVEVAD